MSTPTTRPRARTNLEGVAIAAGAAAKIGGTIAPSSADGMGEAAAVEAILIPVHVLQHFQKMRRIASPDSRPRFPDRQRI